MATSSLGGEHASSENPSNVVNRRIVLEHTVSKICCDFGTSEGIKSLKSLVEAYNAEFDPCVRSALRKWLAQYVAWFRKNKSDSVDEDHISEYAEIACIQPRQDEDKKLLHSFFTNLCDLVDSAQFNVERSMKTLCFSFKHLDLSVLKLIKLAPLEKLLFVLISKLPPATTFSISTFDSHKYTLETIQQTLIAAKTVARRGDLTFNEGGVYDIVEKRMDDVKRVATFYPFDFHATRIKRFIRRLKEEYTVGRGVVYSSRLWRSPYGLVLMPKAVESILKNAPNLQSILTCMENIRLALSTSTSQGTIIDWHDLLQSFATAVSVVAQDSTKIELFDETYKIVISSEKNMDNLADRLALRFGAIDLLSSAVSQRDCPPLCDRAGELLLTLEIDESMNVCWKSSHPLLEAYFDALQDVFCLTELQEQVFALCETLLNHNDDRVQETFEEWLDDEPMKEKLAEKQRTNVSIETFSLFETIKQDVGIHATHDDIASATEDLRSNYQTSTFARATATLSGDVIRHVSEFEHDLVYYEEAAVEEKRKSEEKPGKHKWQGVSAKHVNEEDQLDEHYKKKHRIRSPITLDQLFTIETSSRRDESKKLADKILVYGDPGSGKTTISKKLAHDWAVGKWGTEFERVYHLEMRALRSDESIDIAKRLEISLEAAIANLCFPRRNDSDYDACLLYQIRHDLKKSSTLIIIDGIDECSEEGRQIEEQAINCSAKLLLLSRPYNLKHERDIVDLEVECLGLNNNQLQRYIESEFPNENGVIVVNKLKENSALWQMARIPVTAQIVCYVYKDLLRKGKKLEIKNNMYSMYSTMVRSMWARYIKKSGKPKLDRLTAFHVLERIAFNALHKGKILVDKNFITKYSASGTYIDELRDCGLLLLEREGYHYQFPHLTFQEFFAGLYMQRHAFCEKSSAKTDVVSIIGKSKYSPKYQIMLAFAAQANMQKNGKQGFTEMQSLLDLEPIELMGVQHLVLKLRSLEACLSFEADVEYSEVLTTGKATRMIDDVKELVRVLADDMSNYGARLLFRMASQFKDLKNVVKFNPDAFRPMIDYVKSRQEMGEADDQIRVIEAFKNCECLIQRLLDINEEVCNRKYKRHSKNPSETAKSMTSAQTSDNIVRVTNTARRDEHNNVREASVNALKAIVEVSSVHAPAAVDVVLKACGDEDWDIRYASVKCIEGDR